MSSSDTTTDAVLLPRTVVIPLDGSAVGQRALPFGHRLASAMGATVQTVAVGWTDARTPVDVVLDGDPAAVLLEHVAATDRAALCLSSHGHGGIRRRLIGSVTESLLRASPAPVVVVGPSMATPDVHLPRTIVAGVRRSEHVERLLATLSTWAPHLGAGIELTHVREPSAVELYAARVTGQAPADVPDLERYAERLRGNGIATSTSVVTGSDRTAALLAVADRVGPPVLLAVDTHHGDDTASRDVAYQLVRRATWPILASVGART